MATYRKFDRFRAHSAFITDELNFIANTANKLTSGGTGTPANAYATGGGYNLVTSAVANDSSNAQRAIESAGTGIANIPFAKNKKVSAVARFEHANFTGINIQFGLCPIGATPFASNTGAFIVINADGSYAFKLGGANAVTGQLPQGSLAQARDKFGGVDLEIYHDGAGKLAFFLGGYRIGGADVTYDAQGVAQGGVAALLSLSVGIVAATAGAKTVKVVRLGSAHQIAGHSPQ
jgi:hypothetical protein